MPQNCIKYSVMTLKIGSPNWCCWVKIKGQPNCISSGSVIWSFQILETTHNPFLIIPIFLSLRILTSVVTCHSLTPLPPYKASCEYIEATWTIQDNLMSKVLCCHFCKISFPVSRKLFARSRYQDVDFFEEPLFYL